MSQTNKLSWYCPRCIFSQLPDINLGLSVDQVKTSENIKLQPDESFKKFISACQNLIYNNDDDENEDNIFTRINSKYYDLPDINNLSNESSLGILHTNLASLYKYHDLEQILSLMKIDFQIIGITEHKIKDLTPISNVKLAGRLP